MAVFWQRTAIAVQPRIWPTRSFDQHSHPYLGYALRLQGNIGDPTYFFALHGEGDLVEFQDTHFTYAVDVLVFAFALIAVML